MAVLPRSSCAALASTAAPDKAARERPCEYLCWCIVCPKGLMMEPEKRSKIGLLREAKSQTPGVSSSPNGLTPLFAASLLAAAYKDLNIRDDG
jgi:hypothetical protein